MCVFLLSGISSVQSTNMRRRPTHFPPFKGVSMITAPALDKRSENKLSDIPSLRSGCARELRCHRGEAYVDLIDIHITGLES